MPTSSTGRGPQGSPEGITNVPIRKSQHLETEFSKTPTYCSIEQATERTQNIHDRGHINGTVI